VNGKGVGMQKDGPYWGWVGTKIPVGGFKQELGRTLGVGGGRGWGGRQQVEKELGGGALTSGGLRKKKGIRGAWSGGGASEMLKRRKKRGEVAKEIQQHGSKGKKGACTAGTDRSERAAGEKS